MSLEVPPIQAGKAAFIYNALETGWVVRKVSRNNYEFSKPINPRTPQTLRASTAAQLPHQLHQRCGGVQSGSLTAHVCEDALAELEPASRSDVDAYLARSSECDALTP
jgi:hypothetical protein